MELEGPEDEELFFSWFSLANGFAAGIGNGLDLNSFATTSGCTIASGSAVARSSSVITTGGAMLSVVKPGTVVCEGAPLSVVEPGTVIFKGVGFAAPVAGSMLSVAPASAVSSTLVVSWGIVPSFIPAGYGVGS